ncbi:MAG: hypothetical protein GY851_14490 [bacterium]|nr:hypothetical protein [bacterium]
MRKKTIPIIVLGVLALSAGLLVWFMAGSDSFDPLPPTAAGLAGTDWLWDGLTVSFSDAANLRIVHEKRAPDGIPGTFTVEDRVIEVSVIGRIRAGYWDGTRLVIDGVVAERIK